MATHKTEKYYRILLLLAKGCTTMTRAMIKKQVKDSAPPINQPNTWTVDDLLFTNQQRLFYYSNGKRRHILDRHRTLMIPVTGHVDLEQWDLLLTLNVLLNICDLPSIVRMDLKMLKKRRNKLCHAKDADMSDEKYEEYLEQLKIIIGRCLKWVGDSELTADIEKLIDDIKEGSHGRLQEFMTNMEEWRQNEQTVTSQLQAMRDILKTISRDQFSTIEDKLNKIMQHVKPDTMVPGTKLTMVVDASSNEQTRQICKQLISLVDPKIQTLAEDVREIVDCLPCRDTVNKL